MKKLYKTMAMCLVGLSLTAFAQSGDTMKHDDSMKQDDMKHDDNLKQDDMKKDEMKK